MVILAVAAVIAIFAVSAYYLSLPSALDAFDNKPVDSAKIALLTSASTAPFVNSGSTLESDIRNFTTAQPLTSHGKPVLLYIGEEGCPYCAEMRWALVLSLMRFGTFSNLAFMTSAYDATDFPTFTFHGSSYQSSYIVFAPYETLNRGTGTVDTPPSNYSSIFSQYSVNGGVPFVDYGGKYYSPGALLPATIPGYASYIDYLSALFGTRDWNGVISSINNAKSGGNDPLGSLILAGANVITAKICALTGGNPSSICSLNPINVLGPSSSTLEAPGNWTGPVVTSMEFPRRISG